MPRLIPKHVAVERIVVERRSQQTTEACLMCALLEHVQSVDVVARTGNCAVVFSRYPRAWGHLLVIPTRHAVTFTGLEDAVWAEACGLAARAARALEATFEPARCYVASLGTADDAIPMSSPHLHLHVIPVLEATISPSRMLSWDGGVWEGSEQEWTRVRALVGEQWARAAADASFSR